MEEVAAGLVKLAETAGWRRRWAAVSAGRRTLSSSSEEATDDTTGASGQGGNRPAADTVS
jgi:hypothetical protein